MKYISASLLSADLTRLAQAIESVQAAVDYIHCDVMDGHFVPNLTFGVPVVAAIKIVSAIPLDVHLMIESPGKWVDKYISAGLEGDDFLTFHWEAEPDPAKIIASIRQAGVRPGISIKPGTPLEAIEPLVASVDQILIMTVEPGFGGQSFIIEMLDKVRRLRSIMRLDQVIAVDGGIDPDTAPLASEAGVDLFVAGSAIFGKPDPNLAARELRKRLNGSA